MTFGPLGDRIFLANETGSTDIRFAIFKRNDVRDACAGASCETTRTKDTSPHTYTTMTTPETVMKSCCRRWHDAQGSRNRLYGGNSDNGGLSNVNWNDADNRNENIGFRPLDRLSQRTRIHAGFFVREASGFFIHPPSIFPVFWSGSWSKM